MRYKKGDIVFLDKLYTYIKPYKRLRIVSKIIGEKAQWHDVGRVYHINAVDKRFFVMGMNKELRLATKAERFLYRMNGSYEVEL